MEQWMKVILILMGLVFGGFVLMDLMVGEIKEAIFGIVGAILIVGGIWIWDNTERKIEEKIEEKKIEKKREALDGGTESGFGMLPWERGLLTVAVVAVGLWLIWNGAAWIIAKFLGTVQTYR